MNSQRIRPAKAVPAALAAGIAAFFTAQGCEAAPLTATLRPNPMATATLVRKPDRGATTAAVPASGAAMTATVVVTSCDDDGGTDTLRHAILVADEGGTVDLSGLACSKITLQSGELTTYLNNLTIVGAGPGKPTIDGAKGSRVFVHKGSGTLNLSSLTVANGQNVADAAYGGCIYSKHSVQLENAVVTGCAALGQSKSAGGGILALDAVTLIGSTVSNSIASTQSLDGGNTFTAGGGIFASYHVTMKTSVVTGNKVKSMAGTSIGGGAMASELSVKYSTVSKNDAASGGDVDNLGIGGALAGSTHTTIFASTIEGNSADAAGAMYLTDDAASTAGIVQSTISGNVGRLGEGAFAIGSALLRNSTIAFNESGSLAPVAALFSYSATLQSTIVADNFPIDVAATVIGGDHNIIKIVLDGTTVPADTKTFDPQLLPLALNGGATRTHALGIGSPAIGQGSNPGDLPVDQRGPTFKRLVGGTFDIGAFEFDGDHIFGAVFD